MRTMMRLGTSATMLAVAVPMLASCVTINIYFPAAAAEKAADRIIEEVWQLKDGAAAQPAQPSGEQAK